LNTQWIDISFTETLTKGFTVLVYGSKALWAIYILVLFTPILFDLPPLGKYRLSQAVVALVLILALPAIFLASSSLGIRAANRNKGPHSVLPLVSFTVQGNRFTGLLLLAKEGRFYVYDVQPPLDANQEIKTLTVYSESEIHDAHIVGFNSVEEKSR
jgi:hypothetical protein